MKRFFTLCLVAVAFATAPAFADFQTGHDAYKNKDYVTARVEWQPLAEQGDAEAQYFLGTLYQNGWGVLKDDKQSARLMRLSAKQGYAKAQYNLGLLYAVGEGVSQDYDRAYKWLTLAVLNGEKKAAGIRDSIAKGMSSARIKEAKDLAKKCLADNYKGCWSL